MTNYRKQLEAIGGYENELLPVPAGGVRKIIEALEKAQQQLAAEQAYSAKLREALKQPLGYTGSRQIDSEIRKALALPHDDTSLREWGARLLEKAASKQGWKSDQVALEALARQLRRGEWKP